MKLLGMLLLAAVCVPRPSAAATIIFDVCETASLCNQVSMTTTLTGGAIDVAVTAPTGYGIFGATGANRAFGFNVVGSEAGLTLTNLTSGFSLGGTDLRLGGYGIFEYAINGPGTGSAATLPLLFTVSRTGGFLSDLDLFETNAAGYIAAAHLRNNQTGLTGFTAADSGPNNETVVPEPGTMLLLGSGLVLAARARRRQQAKAATC